MIGVMPPGWKFPIEDEHIDYVLPLQYLAYRLRPTNRGAHFLSVVGRLKTGRADPKGGSGANSDCRTPLETVSRHEHEFHGGSSRDAAFRCQLAKCVPL